MDALKNRRALVEASGVPLSRFKQERLRVTLAKALGLKRTATMAAIAAETGRRFAPRDGSRPARQLEAEFTELLASIVRGERAVGTAFAHLPALTAASTAAAAQAEPPIALPEPLEALRAGR